MAMAADNFAGVPILNEDWWQTLEQTDIQKMLRYRELSPEWRDKVDRYLPGVYGYAIFKPHSTVVAADQRYRALKPKSTSHLALMLKTLEAHLTRLATDGDEEWLIAMARNCYNLREITLYHILWNDELLELLHSCERLEKVTLRGALWVEDDFTWELNNINHIEIDQNECIEGSFLAHLRRPLDSLCLHACSLLQSDQLQRHVQIIRNVTRLELDECPLEVLTNASALLRKLPLLQVLSLSDYTDARGKVDGLAKSIGQLDNLRKLRLRRNDGVDDRFLKELSRGCRRLDTLDVSRCNGSSLFKGVTDSGLAEILQGHPLATLDVSFLEGLTDLAVIHACQHLHTLRATHVNEIEQKMFYFCFLHCKSLQVLDIRGCEDATPKLVQKIGEELALNSNRQLTIFVGGTSYYKDDSVKIPDNLTVSLDWPLEEPWNRHLSPYAECQDTDTDSDE